MIGKWMTAAWLAVAATTPALAQLSASALTTTDVMSRAPVALPSSTQLAAARPVIEKLWPLGTYRRMMDGTMSKIMDSIVTSMFDMPAADVVNSVDTRGKAGQAVGTRSLGEVAQAGDPALRERMTITMDVMMREMIPLMEAMEPTIRDNLTSIYARRFTAAQLADMATFFATPSGSAYAQQSMMLFMDPEIVGSMQKLAPEMMKAMPGIITKIEAATAHLPAPRKPAKSKID